jgi:hypothetical protein
MLQAVSLVCPRHWLHPLHLFNREPQYFTLEEHVKVPMRIRLQRSSCEPRLVRSRLVVNKPLCKHKGYLTYGGIGEFNGRSGDSSRSLTIHTGQACTGSTPSIRPLLLRRRKAGSRFP